MEKTVYVGKDGTKYPIRDAAYPTAFRVFRKDVKTAIKSDGHCCIEAKGLCRQPNVIEAWVGSGNIAHVVYRGEPDHENPEMRIDHAVRYLIRAKAARVRDAFDANKDLRDQTITLDRVPPALSKKAQAKKKKVRAEKIQNGAVPKRSYNKTGATSRLVRIGVVPRKSAPVIAGS